MIERPSRSIALAAGALALAVASPASAFEKQWHVGARAGVGSLESRGWGPALGLHGAYGISDMFDVTVEGLASRHGGSDGTDVLSGCLGLSYKVDVFEWIPYVTALGGYYSFSGRRGPGGEVGGLLGGSLQVGLDYLLMRNFAVGADIRWHANLHDGFHIPLFTGTLGAEYRFGY